jgi:hypothetical protein
VGVGAAQHHRLEHARQSEIIRIETSARNVTGTFFATGTGTDVFFINHKSLPFFHRVQAEANKIRNPNIEIRNKSKIEKPKTQIAKRF